MEYRILNTIKSPDDVKMLDEEYLPFLCAEIRHCLIETISHNGGHLASNLGTVELTVALHKVFSSPTDSILFDVGHQCYTHKLLTGRFEEFNTLRTENGISGFMRPDENPHDPFVTGHSSNSVSAMYGIHKAKVLQGTDSFTVSVVGDGAMTGGMIYEALNNAGSLNRKFIVVLNDNKMSISRNVGSLARHLTVIRSKSSYHKFKRRFKRVLEAIPVVGKRIANKVFKSKTVIKNAIYKSNLFESMGFSYLGPVDGHNIGELVNIFNIAKTYNRPVLVHTITTKGKGYSFAESDPKAYHGVSSFDVSEGTGASLKRTFSDVCGDTLCVMAATDEKVCAITAAMTSGTGLTEFSKSFKNRFFDVGIAEEHAATFSAGMAIKGLKPYFVVYSSFLQRSYDQIVHDIAIAGNPVRLCVDRAGFVGEDGESHQGLFDVAFLSTVPGMTIYSPYNFAELEDVLQRSLYFDAPCAIRYPRGSENIIDGIEIGNEDYSLFGDGNNLIITYGRAFSNAYNALQKLDDTAVLKLNKIYPVSDKLCDVIKKFKNVYFFEEGIKSGGIAEQLGSMLIENQISVKYKIFAVDNQFVSASTTEAAMKKFNLDTDSIIKIVKGDN